MDGFLDVWSDAGVMGGSKERGGRGQNAEETLSPDSLQCEMPLSSKLAASTMAGLPYAATPFLPVTCSHYTPNGSDCS